MRQQLFLLQGSYAFFPIQNEKESTFWQLFNVLLILICFEPLVFTGGFFKTF
jgi:hypothetical protein